MDLDNRENGHVTNSPSQVVDQSMWNSSDTYNDRMSRRLSQQLSEHILK